MLLADLIETITVLESSADMALEITGVSYDSRTTEKGNLFIAVKGYETDGHAHIDAAMKKGASCVLCEDKPQGNVPYILTDNTRRGLALAASNWFYKPSSHLKLVGVTGTNGKTTTTSLIKTIIEKCADAKVGLIGTNANVIGDIVYDADHTTPGAYELHQLFRNMVDAGCTYAVMEVSSHALSLDRVYGIEFEVGVFTNLTHEHLDFHKTMDEYAAAKALIFAQSKYGVVNMDDEHSEVMINAAKCPIMTISLENDEANLVAKRIQSVCRQGGILRTYYG